VFDNRRGHAYREVLGGRFSTHVERRLLPGKRRFQLAAIIEESCLKRGGHEDRANPAAFGVPVRGLFEHTEMTHSQER
jgi:hypothetical protein